MAWIIKENKIEFLLLQLLHPSCASDAEAEVKYFQRVEWELNGLTANVMVQKTYPKLILFSSYWFSTRAKNFSDDFNSGKYP